MLAFAVTLPLTSHIESSIPVTIGETVPTTAIYTPPVRLGGRGGILFIPGGGTAAAADSDPATVLAALHRKLAAGGETACLN